MTRTPPAPLGRAAATDVLDWAEVEPRAHAPPKDGLGLTHHDRAALGMSVARTADAPTLPGDAHAALADLLHRGAAIGKSEKRRK